jgi:hypothetical protein
MYLDYIGGIFLTIHICDNTYIPLSLVSFGPYQRAQYMSSVCCFAFMFAPIRGICVNINFKDATHIPYNVMSFALIF